MNDPDARVIAIGPGGENLVAGAIPLELHRAAGACGTGAVLGSKNIKAVVARGTQGSKIARPDELKAAFKKIQKKLMSGPHYPMFSNYGSSALLDLFNETGMLPTYNWQDREVEGVEQTYSTALKEKYGQKMVACLGCAEDGSLLPLPEGEIEPTLASIQEHVFTPICSACHIAGGTGALMHLDTEGNSYDYLVGVNAPPSSFYCRPFPRVSPGDPDNSCIVMKLEDAPGILNNPMPPPPLPPLDQEQIDAIRQWIADGANP